MPLDDDPESAASGSSRVRGRSGGATSGRGSLKYLGSVKQWSRLVAAAAAVLFVLATVAGASAASRAHRRHIEIQEPSTEGILNLGERDGYDVSLCSGVKNLLSMLPDAAPDSILLDLMLPDGDGLSLISKIREHTQAPIIVVSGKGQLIDKVVGLEMGADDYVCKPFDIKELSARLKAHVRRYQGGTKAQDAKKKISFGAWTSTMASSSHCFCRPPEYPFTR